MAKLPEQFLEEILSLLGEEEAGAYLRCFDEPRLYGLRVNTTKISVEDFLKIFPFPLEPVPWTDNGFYYRGEDRVSRHPYYYAGLYYLQEPSAMLPARLLPVEPGDRVLDTCAAPGGKSTELAAKLNGTGVLFSNDISNSRAQALLKNLELFGIPNAVILSEDLRRLEDRFAGCFDKILVDAPCSGEGMFRKEPAVVKAWLEHG
ncbi:MAG: RsmB/NOP family class I SAM-dependent RNA methyltransferase, partial [Lachnospiraceae bacterium]|nr:RsmB/NOP family class I SAM-dependent RNA methyltransferase [Lachnospiraceae bacterium]